MLPFFPPTVHGCSFFLWLIPSRPNIVFSLLSYPLAGLTKASSLDSLFLRLRFREHVQVFTSLSCCYFSPPSAWDLFSPFAVTCFHIDQGSRWPCSLRNVVPQQTCSAGMVSLNVPPLISPGTLVSPHFLRASLPIEISDVRSLLFLPGGNCKGWKYCRFCSSQVVFSYSPLSFIFLRRPEPLPTFSHFVSRQNDSSPPLFVLTDVRRMSTIPLP